MEEDDAIWIGDCPDVYLVGANGKARPLDVEPETSWVATPSYYHVSSPRELQWSGDNDPTDWTPMDSAPLPYKKD